MIIDESKGRISEAVVCEEGQEGEWEEMGACPAGDHIYT